jgi:hypothetical protein
MARIFASLADKLWKMPNTYARGILFGKMTLELCDVSTVSNDTTDYHCDVDFKAKVSSRIHSVPKLIGVGVDLGWI